MAEAPKPTTVKVKDADPMPVKSPYKVADKPKRGIGQAVNDQDRLNLKAEWARYHEVEAYNKKINASIDLAFKARMDEWKARQKQPPRSGPEKVPEKAVSEEPEAQAEKQAPKPKASTIFDPKTLEPLKVAPVTAPGGTSTKVITTWPAQSRQLLAGMMPAVLQSQLASVYDPNTGNRAMIDRSTGAPPRTDAFKRATDMQIQDSATRARVRGMMDEDAAFRTNYIAGNEIKWQGDRERAFAEELAKQQPKPKPDYRLRPQPSEEELLARYAPRAQPSDEELLARYAPINPTYYASGLSGE